MTHHRLSTIRLPETGTRRDPPKRCEVLQPAFWDRYDSRTLIYDAYHCPRRKIVRLVLPRAFNLRPMLRASMFRIDGRYAKPAIWRTWRHHEIIEFRGYTEATQLAFTGGSVTAEVPISPVDTGVAGLNTVYTLSQDNDLTWLRDWARFHVVTHDLQAVVLFDNGSTAYDLGTLEEALLGVTGIKAVRIVDVPLPYGPLKQDCTNRSDAKFLQVAMLNLARDRFLASSRAWLALDVDELLVSPTGERIFDAVCASRFGHLTFPGMWHYPATNHTAPRHADHRLIRADDTLCPTKYALQPAGIFGDFSLQVHSLEKIHRRYNLAANRFWFMHCYGISTSWKYARDTPSGELTPASDLVQRSLDTAFKT